MPLGLIIFVGWLAFMAIMTGAFIYWAWAEDQFTDEANIRMLIDREPEPWPGREKNKVKKSGDTSTSAGG